MDVIVTHDNADFDALASMAAASRIYPQAVMVLTGSMNRNVREFVALHGDVLDLKDPRSVDKGAVERLVVVDTRIPDRLGEFRDVPGREGVEVFVYDHHPPSPHDMKGVRDYSEETGATVTILVRILRRLGVPLSPFEATLMALGIHEDTGSLTFAGTTAEDAEALAYLMSLGANVNVISRFLGKRLTEKQHLLLARLFPSLETRRVRGLLVAMAAAEVEGYVEGISQVAGKLADLENLEVLFVLVGAGERVVVVGTSRLPQVDVDSILSSIGGGGHAEVGAAVVKGKSLGEVKEGLWKLVEEKVKPVLTAGEIMSKVVRTVHEDTPIAEASRRMERTGHTAFPVVDDEGRMVGMISRKDLDKAGHHGLGHAPVKGFMSRRIIAVEPGASLQEIRKLMTENAIGRVPVMQGGRLAGIVTRKDLLHALHGSEYLSARASDGRAAALTRREMIELMQGSLPAETLSILRRVSRVAAETGLEVYLVGGVVRDLLLGYPNLDLDVVVEGDGVEFARVLAEKTGGRVRSHRKFGTAVVLLPGGQRVDVASARIEYYEQPAALPTVEMSSIRQDLYRRDFTINAMAVALTGERFGELLDYFGGMRDLERRHVRILHNLSFVEDPTRIFRAVRFEKRFRFHMESQTEILARRAVEMEIVGKLTNPRVRDELVDILSEPHPVPLQALERLQELGALKVLHPLLEVTEAVRSRFRLLERHAGEASDLAGPGVKPWIPSLAALLADLPPEEARGWCYRMRIRRRDAEVILQCVEEVPRVMEAFSRPSTPPPSGVARLLDPLKKEALAYLYAVGGPASRALVRRYVEAWRGVTSGITGKDLEAMGLSPSPAYGRILAAVRDAVLDGKVKGRDEELELARRLLEKEERESGSGE
jgi:tRNA nucleotidyltransferase (CCA-adding enzyme)